MTQLGTKPSSPYASVKGGYSQIWSFEGQVWSYSLRETLAKCFEAASGDLEAMAVRQLVRPLIKAALRMAICNS